MSYLTVHSILEETEIDVPLEGVGPNLVNFGLKCSDVLKNYKGESIRVRSQPSTCCEHLE